MIVAVSVGSILVTLRICADLEVCREALKQVLLELRLLLGRRQFRDLVKQLGHGQNGVKWLKIVCGERWRLLARLVRLEWSYQLLVENADSNIWCFERYMVI